MTLLENEVKLSSFTHSVLLTNYRILKEYGNSYKISIFLEKISSIVVFYKSNPFLLFVGGFLIIAGLILLLGVDDYQVFGALSLIVGIACIVLFFSTRKHVIVVSSDGGSDLGITVKNTSTELVEEFITKIQEAKQKKINASR